MPYQGRQPGVGVRDRFIFTATTGQTSFSGNDSNGLLLKYDDATYVDVFINGTLLVPVTDYTATTKTSVVLIDAAAANDVLEILAYGISSIADTVSASSGGTFAADVTFAGDATIGGTLGVTGNVGIGNSIPSSFAIGNLVVGSGSGAEGISIYSGNDSEGIIRFADGTSGAEQYQGQIKYHHDGNYLRFFTTAGERLRIDSAGQLHTTAGITGANSEMATGYVADSGVVYSRGLVSAGARSNNNGYLAGLAIVNGDNAQNGAGAANGRILANIGGMVVTDDSNAGDDSGGDMTFWTKPNGGNLAERMRINSLGAVTINAGNLALDDGNLKVASGHGINFSAYGAGTNIDSNLLDDYEEGTFTPTSGVSLSSVSGTYRKVGKLVHVGMRFIMGASSSGSNAIISGLPFTNENTQASRAGLVVGYHDEGSSNGLSALLGTNGTTFAFYLGSTVKTYANMSGHNVYVGGTYPVA